MNAIAVCRGSAVLRFGSGQRQNTGLVAGGPEKSQEIRIGDLGRAGIDERMAIDVLERRERRVDQDLDTAMRVVDRGEGRDRAGLDAQILQQSIRLAEGEPPRRADAVMQVLQVDVGVMLGNREKQPTLFVDEKEILGVGAVKPVIKAARLLDREQRFMGDSSRLDPKPLEIGEQVFRRGGHDQDWRGPMDEGRI